jgi:hypothetical protein
MCSKIAFSSLLKNRSINFCLIKTKVEHNLASFLPRNAPILSEISLILSEIAPISSTFQLPLFLFSLTKGPAREGILP